MRQLTPAEQLAGTVGLRSGCAELLSIGHRPEPAGPVLDPVTAEPSELPVATLGAAALRHPAHLLRRALHASVVVDLDAVDQVGEHTGRSRTTAALADLATTAPHTVLVSADRSREQVHRLLDGLHLTPVWVGSWTHGPGAGSTVAVLEGQGGPSSITAAPPADFTVTAFVTVFNEEDMLGPVLDDLEAQGVAAYVLDNWSTDDSWAITQERLGGAVVGAERWPADGPPEHFDLRANLERISELCRELDTDWAIKHDADEFRRSPWPGVTVREALWRMQCAGYNIADFTVLNYHPTDDDFARGIDPWEHFRHFEFGEKPGHFKQFKAWRVLDVEVDYSQYGSHRIEFPGARIAPYKFELHHYPIRSQEHGVRKVLAERLARYLPEARARGWHTHYDDIDASTQFVRDPGELIERTPDTWDAHRVELLSGAGLPRG